MPLLPVAVGAVLVTAFIGRISRVSVTLSVNICLEPFRIARTHTSFVRVCGSILSMLLLLISPSAQLMRPGYHGCVWKQ